MLESESEGCPHQGVPVVGAHKTNEMNVVKGYLVKPLSFTEEELGQIPVSGVLTLFYSIHVRMNTL